MWLSTPRKTVVALKRKNVVFPDSEKFSKKKKIEKNFFFQFCCGEKFYKKYMWFRSILAIMCSSLGERLMALRSILLIWWNFGRFCIGFLSQNALFPAELYKIFYSCNFGLEHFFKKLHVFNNFITD